VPFAFSADRHTTFAAAETNGDGDCPSVTGTVPVSEAALCLPLLDYEGGWDYAQKNSLRTRRLHISRCQSRNRSATTVLPR
jgi:hypothetical protein